MMDIKQRLEEYGADVKTIMNRFVDDEELYIECLAEFFEDDEMNRLKNVMTEKDYKTAFEYAHSIKGVSGNLGLDALYEAVCELVEALRYDHTENADELFAAAEREYVRAKEFFTAG